MSTDYVAASADFSHNGKSVAASVTPADVRTPGVAPLGQGGGGDASIHNESPSPVSLIFTPAPIGGSARPPR